MRWVSASRARRRLAAACSADGDRLGAVNVAGPANDLFVVDLIDAPEDELLPSETQHRCPHALPPLCEAVLYFVRGSCAPHGATLSWIVI
jgi:hypothetical protein